MSFPSDSHVEVTLSPAQVNANTSAEQDFNVTGVDGDDVVIAVIKPTAQAGLGIVGWRVKSDGVVSITFGNFTAAPITPTATEIYKLIVKRGWH